MVIDACAELAKQYVSCDKNTSLPALPSKQPTVGGWFKPSQKMAARLGPPSPSPQAAVGKAGPGVGAKQTVLVVVGTYTIGKERVLKGKLKCTKAESALRLTMLFVAVAKALSSKIYCDSRKHAVFMCQADPALHAMLTKNPAEAQVHVLPLGQINIERLKEYLELHGARHDRILGFRPTGWT